MLKTCTIRSRSKQGINSHHQELNQNISLAVQFLPFRIESLTKQYVSLEDEFREALTSEESRFKQVMHHMSH